MKNATVKIKLDKKDYSSAIDKLVALKEAGKKIVGLPKDLSKLAKFKFINDKSKKQTVCKMAPTALLNKIISENS